MMIKVLRVGMIIACLCFYITPAISQVEKKVRAIEITGEVSVVNLNKGIPNASPWPVVLIKYELTGQMFRLMGELESELMKLNGKKVTVVGVVLKELTPLYYKDTPLIALSVKDYRIHSEEEKR